MKTEKLKIKLIYGDTIEQMKLIPDKSVDFICCDLPYGMTAPKWDEHIDMVELWKQYNRIIKKWNNCVICFTTIYNQNNFKQRKGF